MPCAGQASGHIAVMTTAAPARTPAPVPVRAIATAPGLALLTVVGVLIVMRVERVPIWLAISAFLTTALWPVVAFAQRRMHAPRSLAVFAVFVVAALLIAATATSS